MKNKLCKDGKYTGCMDPIWCFVDFRFSKCSKEFINYGKEDDEGRHKGKLLLLQLSLVK